MNREEVSKLIPILQAFVDGKELRRKYGAGFVNDHDEIHLDQEYIIKPEPREFWLSKTNYDTSMDRIVLEDRPSDFYDPTAFIHVREVIE